MSERARPLVKICGVTRVADARRAVELGADLLGLNFHPPSPRCLGIDAARRLADAVRGRVRLVGIFVDRTAAELEEVVEWVGLDLAQLHGDEAPEGAGRLAGRVLRAFRLDDDWDAAALGAWPEAWGFLFEARHARLHGGTGTPWAYERIADLVPGRPVLVAGGVGPENVCEALRRSAATGVDVCSGVESAPGIKSAGRLERLFESLRTCYGSGR